MGTCLRIVGVVASRGGAIARRFLIGFATAALAAAACSPASDPASTSRPSVADVPTTLASPRPSTASTAPRPTITAPAPDAPGGVWVLSMLGEDETVIGLAELDGIGILLTQTRGRLRSYTLDGNRWAPLQPEPIVPNGLESMNVSWRSLAADGDRIVVTGSGNLVGTPRSELRPVFASSDDAVAFTGSTVESTRLGSPYDITTDARQWIAVGAARTSETRWGPGVWASSDGIVWSEVPLRDEWQGQRFELSSVAAHDGQYVATAGRPNGRIVVLRSADGATWHRTAIDNPSSAHVRVVPAQAGFELLSTGASRRWLLLGRPPSGGSSDARMRSLDGGATWTPLQADPSVFGDGLTISSVGHERGVTVASGGSVHRANVLHCYDDLATCQHEFNAVWISDGNEWWRLDLSGIALDRLRASALVGGTTSIVDSSDGSLRVWTWDSPDGAPSPPKATPLDTSPPETNLVLTGDGTMELGVKYALPHSDFCGNFGYLGEWNGLHWSSTDAPRTVDPAWPSHPIQLTTGRGAMVYGVAELVAEHLIEYSVPGFGVVATYRPSDYVGPVFCD